MKVRTEFPREIVEHADWGIEMPDGCRLSARVWLPVDAEQNPVPVILEHLPYRKRDGTIVRDQYTHPWMAGHGYACIRTDMRGNGDSEGLMEDEYLEQELQDACDVISWAAAQPWCNGKVGMMGISWGGFNGLQVAARQPEALKAVITICSTTDRYADDIHYKGGCLLLENFGWSANMLSYSSRPPDPALVGDKWQEMWLHRLNNQPWHLSTWLRHQHRDDYWKHGSVCEDYNAIQAAVLSIGGWHDGYRNTISHLVENLDAPVKGIVGPWNHKYPHYAGPKPAIGFLQEAKRWWDHWLKDEETGVEDDPAYRAYVMDSLPPKRWYDERPGRWIAEQNWPVERGASYQLMPDGVLGEQASDLHVVVNSPPDCGRQSGEYFPFAYSDELPDDQVPDDELSACFDTREFAEAVDIVGAPEICVSLQADQPQAQMAVRLSDVHPDGSATLITHGCLNLCHRDCHEFPTALVPGETIAAKLKLDQCAYHLPAGHRLRVAISNAYWPFIWPAATPLNATLILKQGSFVLPTRPHTAQAEWVFEEPEGAAPWNCENLRPASYSRTTQNHDDGTVVTTVLSDAGENRDLDHGLISGTKLQEQFFIHPDDPFSARCTSHWHQVGGREGQMWRTEAQASMTSDQNQFHSKAYLCAYLNEELVFERHFDDRIDRDLV
ncbi:MAG: CocE/NonD family hydrolase [Rhizobiaceae bacterium]